MLALPLNPRGLGKTVTKPGNLQCSSSPRCLSPPVCIAALLEKYKAMAFVVQRTLPIVLRKSVQPVVLDEPRCCTRRVGVGMAKLKLHFHCPKLQAHINKSLDFQTQASIRDTSVLSHVHIACLFTEVSDKVPFCHSCDVGQESVAKEVESGRCSGKWLH